MANRGRLGLVVPVRAQCDELILRAAQAGTMVMLVSTFRSWAEQDSLFALGRTRPGAIVTYARGGRSWHNWGCAFDLATIGCDDLRDEDAVTCGRIAHEIGLEWGGDWIKWQDPCHFQARAGRSITEMLSTSSEEEVEKQLRLGASF